MLFLTGNFSCAALAKNPCKADCNDDVLFIARETKFDEVRVDLTSDDVERRWTGEEDGEEEEEGEGEEEGEEEEESEQDDDSGILADMTRTQAYYSYKQTK